MWWAIFEIKLNARRSMPLESQRVAFEQFRTESDPAPMSSPKSTFSLFAARATAAGRTSN
jgi:hypothetical protein